MSPYVRTVEGAGGADQQCTAADHVLATATCGDTLVAYRLLGLEQAAQSKSRLTPTPSSPPTLPTTSAPPSSESNTTQVRTN